MPLIQLDNRKLVSSIFKLIVVSPRRLLAPDPGVSSWPG